MKKFIRIIFLNILIALTIIVVFDVAMYHFAPIKLVANFQEYRIGPQPVMGGLGNFPAGYYEAHEKKGFDIARNSKGEHWVSGITYPIWSNSLGCFDREHEARAPGKYIYFAGDSHTWGYTPFDQKFTTIIERQSGKNIFKCGVSHSGQKHQYEKFFEVVNEVGRKPDAVFVSYVHNDVANDYTYPHSTVIHGSLIDMVALDESNHLVHHSQDILNKKVNDELKRMQIKREISDNSGWLKKIKQALKYHSLSLNIFIKIKSRIIRSEAKAFKEKEIKSTLKSINKLPRTKDGKFWYRDNPNAQMNKDAILDFSRYSKENNIDLIMILVPDAVIVEAQNRDYYFELREFLAQNKIKYLDLTPKFIERGLATYDLSWAIDPHYSPSGNAYTAEVIMEEFPSYFQHKD